MNSPLTSRRRPSASCTTTRNSSTSHPPDTTLNGSLPERGEQEPEGRQRHAQRETVGELPTAPGFDFGIGPSRWATHVRLAAVAPAPILSHPTNAIPKVICIGGSSFTIPAVDALRPEAGRECDIEKNNDLQHHGSKKAGRSVGTLFRSTYSGAYPRTEVACPLTPQEVPPGVEPGAVAAVQTPQSCAPRFEREATPVTQRVTVPAPEPRLWEFP